MQIQIWITNSKIVNEVDFLSLATFLSMLPEKKRIEDLHVLLKTMHRYTYILCKIHYIHPYSRWILSNITHRIQGIDIVLLGYD